jgi:tetratricopeptide (TPR) repeat protein
LHCQRQIDFLSIDRNTVTHLLHVWLWLASIAVFPPASTRPVAPRPVAIADSGEATHTLDSALARADEAMARGRPWQATRILAPWLSDSSRRTPATVYLAARAASEWRGWREVLQLLSGEQWIDSLYSGNGRVLLARAALERHQDSLALEHAARAVQRQPSGERLFLLATALDRRGARDSAAEVYARAAERLPVIADWLLLRSAAVTDDSVARAGLYSRITNPLARGRIPLADASAHQGTGDLEGAARRYAAAGERLTSLRRRLAASPDCAPRAALRRELLTLVAVRAGSAA